MPVFLAISAILVIIPFLILMRMGIFRGYFMHSYLAGLRFWARWLPILSMFLFVFIIFANVSHALGSYYPLLSTKGVLKKQELFLLAILAPFFLTQFGAIVACCISIYLSCKIAYLPMDEIRSLFGVSAMLACSGFVSFLGDKIFRHPPTGSVFMGDKIRYLAKWLISLFGIIFTIGALFNQEKILDWYQATFFLGANLSSSMIILLLVALALGWVFVLMTAENHFIYAVLCLPTIMIFAYFSAEFYPFTILPAVTCLSLLVSSANSSVLPGGIGA